MSALQIHSGPVVCNHPGCEREWSADLILAVSYPDCRAGVGVRCKRPSGHSGPFVDAHDARDLEADRQGAYGNCPLGLCGVGNLPAAQRPAQQELLL
jgi:hypothetical protein